MKNTFTIICVMFSVLTASAQLTITPKAGIVFAKGDIDQEAEAITGYTFGVSFTYPLNSRIAIQGDPQFLQKGVRFIETTTESGASIKADQQFIGNYLELPVLARASFGSQQLRFYVNGGVSFGWGVGGKFKLKTTVTSNGATTSESREFKIKFGEGNEADIVYLDNAFDFGLQIGAGVLISEKVQIECRYGYGLTNVLDPAEGTDTDTKNRVIQITAGVPIKL